DNASQKDELTEIKKYLKKNHSTLNTQPSTFFFQNTLNLGFAEGNNVGIRQAIKNGADYIFTLNNDTVVDPQFLTKIIKGTTNHEALKTSSKNGMDSSDTGVSTCRSRKIYSK